MPDPMLPPDAPLTQTSGSLPLPAEADLGFWRSEVERSDTVKKTYRSDWTDNIEWYRGKSPDAAKAVSEQQEYVNVNVDFYQVEQKGAQLFYETPDLQMTGRGPLAGPQAAPIVQAHRELLDELLGESHMDVLATVEESIKYCLAVSGIGPVLVGYQPTLREIKAPVLPGSILGLNGPIQVPIHEQFYGLPFSPDKLLIPADFHSTRWDRAPYLGMRFRMPFTVAAREFAAVFAKYPDFKGTATRDEFVLEEEAKREDATAQRYVDGQAIWYLAAQFDPTQNHPQLYRELVLIDGIDEPARHRDSPHQTIGPDGRMTADSLIGNPIHPLSIRFVPDSAYTPSDSQMTRPLVRELCKFRTQMVQERDANRTRMLYDSEKLPPAAVTSIVNGTLGDMIPVEGGALAQGVAGIMAPVLQGQTPRQTYLANDYITRDIEKTLAIDATGAGVQENDNETATKTSLVDRNRSVRMDKERRQVLKWYLGLVRKVSSLVCRYLTPQAAVQYIGQTQAALWGQWDKHAIDSRIAIDAKPDSQIRIDAAAERKYWMDLYQYTAKDPMLAAAGRAGILRKLMELGGGDAAWVGDAPPQKGPDVNFSFRFQGEDLGAPWSDQVREVLAAGGIQVSQPAVDQTGSQMFQQVALGLRDASGKAAPAQPRLAEHGGPADQVKPLSKHGADESATGRPGPKVGAAA